MTEPLLTGPPPAALVRLLDDGSPFTAPSRVLNGLNAAQACQRVPGAPHTVAEIVAHLRYWQLYTLALARGEHPAAPEHAAVGWPAAPEADWDTLRHDWLAGLEEMKRVALHGDLSIPVRAHETLGHELVLHALHNAVHLGQVMQLRQMLGAWPPPGGGDTW
ncbi:DinB family protein [uncultured Deinococcus sp.]|uniref:DinB family protein n=1 Tax=uncultured Deinococcus sp. TaxID=158789 RepID=UPI0025FA2F26|nr:DinB family protein [uncultured Deinococcus sp.]